MNRLENKVAIITGAAQGMGAAHARMFVDEGARVVMTDVLEAEGKALSKELGNNAMFIRHDVTQWDEWRGIVERCTAEFGDPTVLINNAGVLGPIVGTVDFDVAAYESVCAVNQTGVFLGMKAVIPSMLKAGVGSIVNVSSIAGLAAVYGSPNLAYVCSKFAVRGMTKFVAVEQGKNNIRVNS
ncbi:MAG: SDR family NAD(P)-dependent oxidoreductase, partial [Gammaproteobacteria bacterium]|nr:SDR family NAD(P)-dependent oxidoreductase [Gammaproteobacteria bacterium]